MPGVLRVESSEGDCEEKGIFQWGNALDLNLFYIDSRVFELVTLWVNAWNSSCICIVLGLNYLFIKSKIFKFLFWKEKVLIIILFRRKGLN